MNGRKYRFNCIERVPVNFFQSLFQSAILVKYFDFYKIIEKKRNKKQNKPT